MAKVKQFVFEAAEQAFKTESAADQNRAEAVRDWTNYIKTVETEYGALGVIMALDIFDEIADRAGQTWEDFSDGRTWEELKTIYPQSVK